MIKTEAERRMSNISHIPKEFSFIYADELYDEVKRLERQLEEANGELKRMDRAHYKCSQRCIVHIEEKQKLERQLAEARFAVKTLIGLNEIAYNEGYNDRQKHNKKDYEKTKSSLKVKQLKGKANE